MKLREKLQGKGKSYDLILHKIIPQLYLILFFLEHKSIAVPKVMSRKNITLLSLPIILPAYGET